MLGAVRLWTLIRAAASSDDITRESHQNVGDDSKGRLELMWTLFIPDSSSLGQIVSQLQINFACIAACIPTVLKLLEEGWVVFCVHVLGYEGGFGTSQSNSRRTGGGSGSGTTDIHLSDLKSIERGPKPSGPYASFDRDDLSEGSQQLIMQGTEGKIQVQTDVSVHSRKDIGRGRGDGVIAPFRSTAFRG